MSMFKRKEEDWNIWDDEIQDVSQGTDIQKDKSSKKEKKRLFHRKKEVKEETEFWDAAGEIDYLSEDSDAVYSKDDGVRYSKKKIFIFSLIVLFIILLGIGYMNTDFDENNKGYVVSYDLHYERQYVDKADELYNYCLQLEDELRTVMPALSTNSLETTNEVQKILQTLQAKTDEVARYTEVPQIMSSYNDNLISFAMSTEQMLENMLSNYTSSEYMAWAESAYNDFVDSLNTLKYLREQIDYVIYRNVYGGEENVSE